jgi:hypothetical protein
VRNLCLAVMLISCAAFGQSSQTGSDYIARRLQIPLLDVPQKVPNASVFVSGNPGPATYFYWIVTNTIVGASSPAGPFQLSNAPNTLSGSNFNQISWANVLGAVSFDVLRTSTPAPPVGACNCAVATAVAGSSVNDQANSLNAYTVNTFDPSTVLWTITNESSAAGVSQITFRVGGFAKLSLASNGGAVTLPTPFTAPAHQFLTGLSAGGIFSAAQPASTDLSDVKTLATTINLGSYASWALALADCPAAPSGCILDATSPNSPLAMGAFDVGTKAVTAKLGPFPFTATQITLRTNLSLLGAGNRNASGIGVTSIQSVGANATPLLVIPQSNSTPAQAVKIERVQFIGANGNTSQKGLFADCSTLSNAGLWYSSLTDVDFTGFLGPSIQLKCRPDNASSVNQFLTFTNVHAFRPATGAEALRIENGNGQIQFINSEFDGPGITDGTNIFIGELLGTDTQSPYSIHFSGLTCQSANLCMQTSGVQGLVIDGVGHFESLHGGIQGNIVGAQDNINVVIKDNQFFGTVGVNAGSGFIVKNNSGNLQSSWKFCDNVVEGTPDNIALGSNGNSFSVCDNPQTSSPFVWTSSGLTFQVNPAATLSIGNAHTILLNASGTSITTIQSGLGPGEIISFHANASTAQFASGGNITLTGTISPLVLSAGETATFIRSDLGGTWELIGVISAQGAGWKAQRFGATTATTATAGNTTTNVETWASAFPDANYTVTCNGVGLTGTPALNISSRTASTVTVATTAITAVASSFAEVYCIARHD